MLQLNPHECRVLGVLVEKAQTTPAQYPLTLNALLSGCNQKNNRDPVTNLTEDQVIGAIDSLRAKQLVREVMLSGSRVAKYRHHARDALEIATSELVIMAELLLRGPQTVGELRNRASRMHALDSLEIVQAVLEALGGREEPLVKKVPPAPGSRAPRYAQLLCPGLHRIDTAPADAAPAPPVPSGVAAPPDVMDRLERLEKQVRMLRGALEGLAAAMGETVQLEDDAPADA
ncbi:MAG: YceH family protein [Planctomycetota bacterium]|jgi:uncharacterized protein YceH (UPF0502 family)